MSNTHDAITAWIGIVGPINVITGTDELASAQKATFLTNQTIPAIICPGNRDEVIACVKVANHYKTPIYPISTGKNWGYGSRVPPCNNCVLMDLGRLNRISDYSEKLAYVTVEPGVTFRQLQTFLFAQKSDLTMSMTGGTLDSSLIGNALERGLGAGPYGDRFGYVCGLEVVLPTGECIHTGFERFPNVKTKNVKRWDVGPYVDGIFTQSNLGIVTKMTIWLFKKPKYTKDCLFLINEEHKLELLIDTLQSLKMEGFCSSPFRLYNDYKMLASITQLPNGGMKAQRSLIQGARDSLRKAFGIGAWQGKIELWSSNRHYIQLEEEIIQKNLEDKVDQIIFIDSAVGSSISNHDTIGSFSSIFNLRATFNAVNSMHALYWRKNSTPPAQIDPDRDGCGLLWGVPSAPFDGAHVRSVVDIIEQSFAQHQFEPSITVICLTERNVIVSFVVTYDRDVPGEDICALACHDDTLQRLISAGYIPYRLGIQSMNSLPPAVDDYGKFIRTLKTALDPNGILAPGRYDFQADGPQHACTSDGEPSPHHAQDER